MINEVLIFNGLAGASARFGIRIALHLFFNATADA